MRSFGTLYESHRSRKKCSETLGSRSIDWRGQKVPGGKRNCKKGDNFWVRESVLTTACCWQPKYWWFYAPEGPESSISDTENEILLAIWWKIDFWRFSHFSNSSKIWFFDCCQIWFFGIFQFRSKFVILVPIFLFWLHFPSIFAQFSSFSYILVHVPVSHTPASAKPFR